MNKILVFVLVVCSTVLYGQDIQTVLKKIEANHPGLQAAQAENQSRIKEYKTSLQPPDPEAEYGYFSGNTSAVGIKKVFGIEQRFAFPSEYKSRKGVAEAHKNYDQAEYQELRRKKLLEAKILLLQQVYHRHQLQMTNERLQWTEKFKDDIQKLHEKGAVPRLDINKARMQVTRVRSEKRRIENEISSDSMHIVKLNNRQKISGLFMLEYPPLRDTKRTALIREYVAKHPQKLMAQGQQQQNKAKTRLSKNAYFPGLKVGYKSEQVLEKSHRGFKAGITLPLWEKRHSVNSAKLSEKAADLQLQVINNNLEAEAASAWSEWQTLKTIYRDYEQSLQKYDHPGKLKKAYERKEISSTMLFNELDSYFEFKQELIDFQFKMYKAQARLFSFAL